MAFETFKRAQNLQVASSEEGALVGRLDDFQFDLEARTIFGWRLKASGMFGRSGGVRSGDVLLIGRDLAFIRTERAVEWASGKSHAVGGRAWASTYRGTSAITRRGRSLGAVQDFVIDQTGSRVTGLLLHGGLLVALDERVHLGPAAVILETMEQLIPLPEDDEDDRPAWWDRVREAVARKKKEGDAPSLVDNSSAVEAPVLNAEPAAEEHGSGD